MIELFFLLLMWAVILDHIYIVQSKIQTFVLFIYTDVEHLCCTTYCLLFYCEFIVKHRPHMNELYLYFRLGL